MASTSNIFLESDGIKLPDGTVFGGGIELKFQITKSESRPGLFKVYEIIGGCRVGKFNNENISYLEMREWLHGEVAYYASANMKLWEANHSEWGKATWKKLVTEDW